MTWSVPLGSQPPGRNIKKTKGVISGTPTATGTFNFTIQVLDNGNSKSATQPFTITINNDPEISTTSLESWTLNVAGYNQTVAATGGTGALAWTLQAGDSLPTGLSLNAATGAITGKPTASGTYVFHIVVTDSIGDTATKMYSVTIAAPLSISPNAFGGAVPQHTVGWWPPCTTRPT